MTVLRSERVPAAAGAASGLLIIASFVLVGVDAPGDDATRADIAAAYADDGTQARQGLGLVLMALGGLAFLPFLAYLRMTLSRAAGERSVLPGAAFAGGILFIGGLFVATVLAATVSSAAGFWDEAPYRVNADLAMTLLSASFFVDGLAGVAGGVLVGAASIVAHRARLLPRALTATGLVVAALSLPGALLGAWVGIEAAWIAIAAGLLTRTPFPRTSTTAMGPVARPAQT